MALYKATVTETMVVWFEAANDEAAELTIASGSYTVESTDVSFTDLTVVASDESVLAG